MSFFRELKYRPYLFLIAILIFEYAMFRTFLFREILWNYPKSFDQIYYTVESYHLYDLLLNHDIHGYLHMIRLFPQGILLEIQASLLFLVTGASRLSALTINFVYFALVQFVVFKTMFHLTKRNDVAFFSVGMVLLLPTTFFWAGGMDDFRIDFIGACLFIVFLSFVIRSELFINRKYTIISASIAILMMLTRFITVAYLFGITFIFILIFLFIWVKKKESQQLKNIVLFSGLCILFVAPFLVINFDALYNYYYVGHFSGNEKEVRAIEANIHNLIQSLTYYPKSIYESHYGVFLSVLSAIILVPSLIFIKKWKGKRLSFLYLTVAVLIPFLILTKDTAKSPVVADIMVAPLLWITLISYSVLTNQVKPLFVRIFSYGVLGLGILFFISHVSIHTLDNKQKAEMTQINKLFDRLDEYIYSNQLDHVALSVDRVSPFLNNLHLTEYLFEKRNVYIPVVQELGSSLMDANSKEYLNQVKVSDIVILNAKKYQQQSVFPFDNTVAEFKEPLLQYVRSNNLKYDEFNIYGDTYEVFVKPPYQLIGATADNWLLNEGTKIVIPSITANNFNSIVLSGKLPSQMTTQQISSMKVTATTDDEHILKSDFTIKDNMYSIKITFGKQNNKLNISVSLDTYFVPSLVLNNKDTRKLSLLKPDNVHFER